jgi:hypothetical protein
MFSSEGIKLLRPRLWETSGDFQKILRTDELARSPQYGDFLTQLARFRFRVSNNFCFDLFAWDYKETLVLIPFDDKM